jgi:hypothetical protein
LRSVRTLRSNLSVCLQQRCGRCVFQLVAVWYAAGMVKTLERAIAEIAALPDADQEQIGRKLLSHVEKLQRLREELDRGVRSLDAGKGREFSIEEFIEAKSR